MFFNTKRNPRKATRQTLSTEQLEPKAMFSVSPVEPVVALDVGPVNQAGYDCQGEGHFQLTHRIGGTAGPGGTSYMTDTDGRMIVHPQFNLGGTSGPGGTTFMTDTDGRMIVHPQFNLGSTSGPGGTSYMTDTDGRMIVHPQFNVGNDGRSIVHPQFHVGLDGLAQANQQPSLTAIRDVDIASESIGGSADPGGDDVFMPKPNRTNVWTNGSATSLAPRHAAFAMMGR